MLELDSLERSPVVDGVAVADMQAPLDAVKARLCARVAPQQQLAGEALATRIRSDVFECVSALDHLQITLSRAIKL